jgi:hypothetical protein
MFVFELVDAVAFASVELAFGAAELPLSLADAGTENGSRVA